MWFDLATPIALLVMVLPVLFSIRYGGLIVSLGTNPILAFAASGAFIVHFSRRPPRAECAATFVLAILLRMLYALVFHGIGDYFGAPVIAWGSFLGLASLVMLLLHAIRAPGPERKHALIDFIAGGSWFYYWIVLGLVLTLTDFLIPRTYDQFLYAFDGSLGFQPSFLAGQFLRTSPLLVNIVYTLYFAIALPVALLYAAQLRRSYALGYKIFPLLIAASTGGFFLYFILPATGPVYEFSGRFPFVIPPVSLHIGAVLPIHERAVRNGMPSLHFGTALMLWWNSRIWPPLGRICIWLFLVATAFATLATGQHYLIDLIVAFPVMLMFHAAGMTALPPSAPERWVPVAAGFMATFAWLAFLRYGVALCLDRPLLSWSLLLITLVGCFLLESRLWKKANSVSAS
jgi:hypothetical protein